MMAPDDLSEEIECLFESRDVYRDLLARFANLRPGRGGRSGNRAPCASALEARLVHAIETSSSRATAAAWSGRAARNGSTSGTGVVSHLTRDSQ
jgi:hypothetical protein